MLKLMHCLVMLYVLPIICYGNGQEVLKLEREEKRFGAHVNVIHDGKKRVIALVNLFKPRNRHLSSIRQRELDSCRVTANELRSGYYSHEILNSSGPPFFTRVFIRVSLLPSSGLGQENVPSILSMEQSKNDAVVSDPLGDGFIRVALDVADQSDFEAYVSKLGSIDTFPTGKIKNLETGIGHSNDRLVFYLVNPNDTDQCLEVWIVDPLFTETL